MQKNFFELADYNTPVYQTSNFIVIPTLGSLIEGWLLIVPKVFYLNFSQLPEALMDEANDIIHHLQEHFLPLFEAPNAVVFEHGPGNIQSTAGCGVDYAHLHWVPTEFDLKAGVKEFLNLHYNWSLINDLTEVKLNNAADRDYLYLRDQGNKSFVTYQKEVPSQTFRKVIAHYLQQPQQFDWKANFGSENIQAVYSKVKV